MKQYIGVFRESLSLFSTSALKKWLAIAIGTCAIFVLMMGRGGDPVYKLFAIAGYIGNLFAFGVPFIVGASLLFGSQDTQNNIVDSIQKSRNIRFAHLFIPYAVLTLFVMALAVVIGFVFIIPSLSPMLIIGFLSYMLVSTFVVSLLVCPITAFLALIIDDWKISIVLGVMLFFAIALATGFPSPVNYPEIAFLGPKHILTAILVILMGGFTSNGFDVAYYVGVDFVLIQLVLPISLFIVIAVFFYLLARWTYHSNLSRWTIERELWLSTKGGKMERWLDTEESVPDNGQAPSNIDLTASHNALNQRRRLVAAILITAILLIPMGGIGYVSVQQDEWTTVVYQTSGSVTVELGVDWLYGEFTGLDPPDNINLAVGIEGVIAGGNGGSAHFNFDHRQMTLNEFLQLNGTEIEDMFGRSEAGNTGQRDTFSSGWSGPIHAHQYVWVLRFNEVGGETVGHIDISFQIIIRAM
ncbi:MAG: hypothetical protein RTS72_00020 [Candidatus Thorarchaeota archaeon]